MKKCNILLNSTNVDVIQMNQEIFYNARQKQLMIIKYKGEILQISF